MANSAGDEPIPDDELIYRRIPVSTNWYDVTAKSLSPKAYRPRDDEFSGISLTRASFHGSIDDAADGPSPKGYFVGVLRVGDLRARGIEVVPCPTESDPGHVEITSLTAANKRESHSEEIMVALAHEMTQRVEGPFLRPQA